MPRYFIFFEFFSPHITFTFHLQRLGQNHTPNPPTYSMYNTPLPSPLVHLLITYARIGLTQINSRADHAQGISGGRVTLVGWRDFVGMAKWVGLSCT